ncbi:coenzyme PQQ precursor peptide PqqA [Bradyrhizobium sp. LM6.10]
MGITEIQLGRLYRIESCTALTTALSGQRSRPNAPWRKTASSKAVFQPRYFAPQHGFIGKISLANFSARTNLRAGRDTSEFAKWRAEMAWKAPKIVEVPCGMEINMYVSATRK